MNSYGCNMVHLIFLLQLLMMCSIPSVINAMVPTRLVITFVRKEDNVAVTNMTKLGGGSIVRQYGRRLVLDMKREFNLQSEFQFFRANMKNVQNVERDIPVSIFQEESFADMISVDDFIQIDISDPDIDGAYVSPGTQTPLWNLREDEPYSIHAEGVWPLTNSTPKTVVAVIDTGIAELAKDSFLNLSDCYDFISDDYLSADNDERGPDATDPGDAADSCPTPSWHGTKVASILAARHDNPLGMKGVAQNCSVLPERVIGLCRMGYAADVADAIIWAAGINNIRGFFWFSSTNSSNNSN
jgi:subtilisin family serine protease